MQNLLRILERFIYWSLISLNIFLFVIFFSLKKMPNTEKFNARSWLSARNYWKSWKNFISTWQRLSFSLNIMYACVYGNQHNQTANIIGLTVYSNRPCDRASMYCKCECFAQTERKWAKTSLDYPFSEYFYMKLFPIGKQ